MEHATVRNSVRFGIFEVDLRAGELCKGGLKIRLQEQPFQVLSILLERPGQVVTREELQKTLWPQDTFVDFDHGLNTAINKIRQALGDSAETPRFVETVARRGYRFIAPGEIVGALDGAPAVAPVSSPEMSLAATSPSETETAVPSWVRTSFDRRYRGGQNRIGNSLPLPSEDVDVVHDLARRRGWIWPLTLAAAGIIVIAAVLIYLLKPPPPPRVLGYTRITNDGRMKDGIVTDGSRIYYTATSAGQPAIYQVSTSGGESVPFAPAFRNASVADISANGDDLLAVSNLITGRGPMWILSLPGGASHRVGNLQAGAWYLAAGATWSRDGKSIAYVDSDAYTADSDGGHPRKIVSFAGTSKLAYRIRWSPDGRALRFSLADGQKGSSIWEVSSSGANLHPLLPQGTEPKRMCCGNWTADGKYFVYSGDNSLWAIREKAGWLHGSRDKPVKLTNGPMAFLWPAASKDGKKLYAVSRLGRGELVRYDAKAQGLFPYLAGISAEGVVFSQDRAWVAYVMYPEGTLWRSRMDGSERLQLSFPPEAASHPR